MEQSLLHRVKNGELTAAQAFKLAKDELDQYNGQVSMGFLGSLLDHGLVLEKEVTDEVFKDNVELVPEMELKIDPVVEEQTLPSPDEDFSPSDAAGASESGSLTPDATDAVALAPEGSEEMGGAVEPTEPVVEQSEGAVEEPLPEGEGEAV